MPGVTMERNPGPVTGPLGRYKTTGTYYGISGILAIAATADAATAFKISLQVPAANPVAVKVRRVSFSSWSTTALAVITGPRITVERATFATVAAATITPEKRVTAAIGGELADAANTARLTTTAPTTPAAAGNVYQFSVTNNETPVGKDGNKTDVWEPGDYGPVLAPLQALVFRQADAGTTADTRKFQISLLWEEYTLV